MQSRLRELNRDAQDGGRLGASLYDQEHTADIAASREEPRGSGCGACRGPSGPIDEGVEVVDVCLIFGGSAEVIMNVCRRDDV